MDGNLLSYISLEDDSESNLDGDETVCETSDCSEGCLSTEEYNRHLQLRIACLRETIKVLRRQLQDEKEICVRKMEERRYNEYLQRATELGYQYFAEPSCISSAPADDLRLNQFESRQNLQKQIALANYKRRLLEVENMCNVELMKMKQNVQILQPLQAMCSEWQFPDAAGDKQNNDKQLLDDEESSKKVSKASLLSFEFAAVNEGAAGETLISDETMPYEIDD